MKIRPDRDLSFSTVPNDGCMPKCVVIEDDFDWQGDVTLNYPLKDCIIYETHVRGLTRSPTARVKHHGTYRGVVETIPYFKDLGITSLELLPVQEFDSAERFRRNPLTGEKLCNFWGYSPLCIFAPKLPMPLSMGLITMHCRPPILFMNSNICTGTAQSRH